MLLAYSTRPGAAAIRFGTRWGLRVRLVGFLRSLRRLPLDRVALLDYDEMVRDPEGGSRWAGHLVDATRLSKEFRACHSHSASPSPAGSAAIDRLLDWYWARTWDQFRMQQLRKGVLTAV